MAPFAYSSTQIRDALAKQMADKGWTQVYLESVSGVRQSQISRILSGETKKLTRDMRKLCEYANLPPVLNEASEDDMKAIQSEVDALVRGSSKRAAAVAALLRAASTLSP